MSDPKILAKLKRIIKDDSFSADQTVAELNVIIHQLNISEQADLHGTLSKEQLVRLYNLQSLLDLSLSAKEHITWKYFKDKYDEDIRRYEYLSQELLDELIVSYKQSGFLALESVIIEGVKSDRIDPADAAALERTFSGKSFIKELAAFKSRDIIRNDRRLTKEQVRELLEFRAYSTLEFALDCGGVSEDGLLVFRMPTAHEQDRKVKERLNVKAQVLLNRQ